MINIKLEFSKLNLLHYNHSVAMLAIMLRCILTSVSFAYL